MTAGLLLLTGIPGVRGNQTYTASDRAISNRSTVAIQYREGESTSVDLVGVPPSSRIDGAAEVKRKDGRTRIKVKLANLDHPQNLGGYFTTYVLWAIAPEGQADNLGELTSLGRGEREIEVTTRYQTFGLIITAEPHGLVKLPSPVIVAENFLRKNTKGGVTTSRIDYRGFDGPLYEASYSRYRTDAPDFQTPLSVLGARRAVEIARRADAERHAAVELREAEARLMALERTWPRIRDEEKFRAQAQDVMRLAEESRALAIDRAQQAALDAERRAARRTIAEARSDAERERTAAEQARETAADYRAALDRTGRELELARERLDQAKTEAERAKANEEVARANEEMARIQAEHAKRESQQAKAESEQAKRDRDAAHEQLFISISKILETRREARGLIVNLSDVLFDFNQATLKPGAREKLSKLSGILLAYPGDYRIEIEGHTDAIGSDEYNLKLSEMRASSVRDYLFTSGINSNRIVAARGFGKTKPVATNSTAEGRQMNRRVEIVIADADVAANGR
jgi:outer membrane protein OmpA-like peptidoglycan-associated protein